MRRNDMKTGVVYAAQSGGRNYLKRARRVVVFDNDFVDAVRFAEASTGESLAIGGRRSFGRSLAGGPPSGSVWVAWYDEHSEVWKPGERRSVDIVEPYDEFVANAESEKSAVAAASRERERIRNERIAEYQELVDGLTELLGGPARFRVVVTFSGEVQIQAARSEDVDDRGRLNSWRRPSLDPIWVRDLYDSILAIVEAVSADTP